VNDDDGRPLGQAGAGPQWSVTDAVAVCKLFEGHRSRVLAYLVRHFPDHLLREIDPADVLQDTFFEAWRAIGRFKNDGSSDALYRWLVTIARHQLIDQIRSRRAAKRGGGLRTDSFVEPTSRVLEELAVHRRTPSKFAATREFFAAVERSIDGLPVDQGTAVRLRHVDQLAIAEVATKMGRTEDAVLQLCNRGLQGLRKALGSASLFR
jgi:RNA polymerase sigma-70 factor, ECF subfamily